MSNANPVALRQAAVRARERLGRFSSLTEEAAYAASERDAEQVAVLMDERGQVIEEVEPLLTLLYHARAQPDPTTSALVERLLDDVRAAAAAAAEADARLGPRLLEFHRELATARDVSEGASAARAAYLPAVARSRVDRHS